MGECNTVFRASHLDFHVEDHPDHGQVLKSDLMLRNWDCKKLSDSEYQVILQYTRDCPSFCIARDITPDYEIVD